MLASLRMVQARALQRGAQSSTVAAGEGETHWPLPVCAALMVTLGLAAWALPIGAAVLVIRALS